MHGLCVALLGSVGVALECSKPVCVGLSTILHWPMAEGSSGSLNHDAGK